MISTHGARGAGSKAWHRVIGLMVLFSLGASCRDVSAPGASPPIIVPPESPPAPIPTRSDGAIYLAPADGTAPTLLTRGYSPAWAPDGRRLAFHGGDGVVYAINADGSGLRRLAVGYEPSWSPDGSRIAFTSRDGISVMNADGSSVTRLVGREVAAGRYRADVPMAVGAPVWSPDAQRIAFLLFDVDHGSTLEILVVSADGGDARTVVVAGAGTGGPTQASWSPDGARLAYSNWEGQAGITVRDLRGAAPDMRYRDPAGIGFVGAPVWSPDGGTLAFTVPVLGADKLPLPGQSEVWRMPSAGGSARLLIRDATNPAWSPDGARIAFVRMTNP